MSYYDDKKNELEDLLKLIREEKEQFNIFVSNKISEMEKDKNEFKKNVKKNNNEINKKIDWNRKLKKGVIQMAKERQKGFPWLANAYEELFALENRKTVNYLKNKKNPALKASEIVKEQSRLKRQAIKEKKIAEYLVAYYENIAPFLLDLKEEIDIATNDEQEVLKDYTEEELQDKTTNYLTKEEYRKLSTVEKNQLALDRFRRRPKSKWLIGRLYERYVGYLYEQKGYDVDYIGIFKGFEDLGRDLICSKGDELIIIQCKNWSKFKTIYEKHIFQFFGTVFQYRDKNKDKNVDAIFYTSTKLSDLAKRFADELKIGLKENFKFDNNYPCIKCNISRANKEKIYHLPFDQQYDNVKIEKDKGEFYCTTVKEAEEKGFRRAFKYRGLKKSK